MRRRRTRGDLRDLFFGGRHGALPATCAIIGNWDIAVTTMGRNVTSAFFHLTLEIGVDILAVLQGKDFDHIAATTIRSTGRPGITAATINILYRRRTR